MTTLRLAAKNLFSFCRNKTLVFILFILCQLISVLAVMMTYGTMKNYIYEKRNDQLFSKDVNIMFTGATYGELKDRYIEALQYLGSNVEFGFLCLAEHPVDTFAESASGGREKGERFIQLNTTLKDGKLVDYESTLKMIQDPKYRPPNEIPSDQPLMIVCRGDFPNGDKLKVGDMVEFAGISFQAVGFHNAVNSTVLIDTVPAELPVRGVYFGTKKMITYKKLSHLVEIFTKDSPAYDTKADIGEIPTAQTEKFYNLNIYVSALIIVLAAINFSILFSYILETRRRSYAIMRMSGCTAAQGMRIYLTEILFSAVPVFLIAAGLYHLAVKLFLSKLFLYFDEIYTPMSYLMMFLIYLAGILLVFGTAIRRFTHVPPVEMKRKG